MIITVDQLISTFHLNIEVDGKFPGYITELNTETGAAKRYKMVDQVLAKENGELVIEEVTFPVDKLHVYLVKPK